MQLAPLEPVVLSPGARASVELKVERAGAASPIQVHVAGAPAGVTCTAPNIPEGQSVGALELVASSQLGAEEVKATLRVAVQAGDRKAEQPLELTVTKLMLPSFVPVGDVILQPGQTAEVTVAVERNGFPGLIAMGVDGLPVKVRGQIAPIPPDQNATTLQLSAASDAPDGRATVRVATMIAGRIIDLQIPVHVDKMPYLVKSFMAVMIKPGETKKVAIPVERRSFHGPLRLEMTGLPGGVTAPSVELAPGQTEAVFELSAAPDTHEHVRSAKVVSKAGEFTRSDPIVVRVWHGEDPYLPREITADPEFMALLRRGSFGGRLTAKSKQALLDLYGGTPESEQAVLRGLRWLAKHRRFDGSWSMASYHEDVLGCDCHTDFENQVKEEGSAGTAFGVLPFLAAGIVAQRAPEEPAELAQYKTLVRDAIRYLIKNQVRSRDQHDGHLGGTMYAHALGTIALCEAYGLSGDEEIKLAAQRAVKYMIQAQHSTGGGWRYGPKQAGDMSVTGWVFLAIRSAQLAGIRIEHDPLLRAERFVDSCAAGPSQAKLSRYGYTPGSDAKLALSAAGLLTRQYLGWKENHPDLLAGAQYLMENLPPESGTNLGPIYYYYYATQVLHHLGGENFDLWNHRMREHLIRTQQTEGHKAGSWDPEGSDFGSRGGRLYSTAMALMTLQVYYRHLPMYKTIQRASDTPGHKPATEL